MCPRCRTIYTPEGAGNPSLQQQSVVLHSCGRSNNDNGNIYFLRHRRTKHVFSSRVVICTSYLFDQDTGFNGGEVNPSLQFSWRRQRLSERGWYST